MDPIQVQFQFLKSRSKALTFWTETSFFVDSLGFEDSAVIEFVEKLVLGPEIWIFKVGFFRAVFPEKV